MGTENSSFPDLYSIRKLKAKDTQNPLKFVCNSFFKLRKKVTHIKSLLRKATNFVFINYIVYFDAIARVKTLTIRKQF